MSFREDVEKEIVILEPKFKEANEAHRLLNSRITYNYRRNGQAYEVPFDRDKSLSLFMKKTQLANSLINPALDELKSGEYRGLPRIFAYLAIKDKYFRSGYKKEKICRALKKANFNEEQKLLLEEIIIKNLGFAGREFKSISSLIPKVTGIVLKKEITKLSESPIDFIRNRAERIQKQYFGG